MKYFIVSLALILSASSCYYSYFNAKEQPALEMPKLEENISAGKKIYLHTAGNSLAVNNLILNSDQLTGDLSHMTDIQKKYLTPDIRKPNRIFKDEENDVLDAIHLYTSKTINDTGMVTLHVSEIDRMVIYVLDKKKSKSSKTGAAVATTISVVALTVVVAGAVMVSDGLSW